jgi:hypothetical protein
MLAWTASGRSGRLLTRNVATMMRAPDSAVILQMDETAAGPGGEFTKPAGFPGRCDPA